MSPRAGLLEILELLGLCAKLLPCLDFLPLFWVERLDASIGLTYEVTVRIPRPPLHITHHNQNTTRGRLLLQHVLDVRCLQRVCRFCLPNSSPSSKYVLFKIMVELPEDLDVAHGLKWIDLLRTSGWANQNAVGHCNPILQE